MKKLKHLLIPITAILIPTIIYGVTILAPQSGGTGKSITTVTKGDLLVGSSTQQFHNLPVGADNNCLTASSTATYGLAFGPCGVATSPPAASSTISGEGSSTQVTIWSATSTLTGDSLLVWDNVNKRLGVGNTQPSSTLHVVGKATLNNLSSTSSTLTNITSNFTAGSILFSSTTNGLITQNNANLFWDNTNNRLGIGTTSPGFLLHLVKDGQPTVVISSARAGAVDNSILGFRFSRGTHATPSAISVGDALGQLDFNGYNDAFRTSAQIIAQADTGYGATGADAPGRLTFWTTPDGSATLAERVRIDNAGNVGIGTTSPGAQTHIVAGAAATKDLIVQGAASQSANLQEWQNSAGTVLGNVDASGYIFHPLGASTTPSLSFVGDTNTGLFSSGADTVNIATGGSERMRVDSSGNVGIGTASPSSTLHIITTNSSTVGLIVKVATSTQTAALQQWQNATGTALSVDPLGKLVFATSTATSTEGSVWKDGTQNAMSGYLAGIQQQLVGTIFTATATSTVANTTTSSTLIGTGIGTTTLPANFFQPGKTVRVRVKGFASNVAVPTMTFDFVVGNTIVATTGGFTSIGLNNDYFEVEAELVNQSTGSSGKFFSQGKTLFIAAAGISDKEMVNTTQTTLDTTVSQKLDIKITWGAASASNTITGSNVTIEILN